MTKSSRSYSTQTLRLLWGRSAGRCALPDCRLELLEDDPTGYDPVTNLADIAHIAGSSDRGPRANPRLSAKQRDAYQNLILLCQTCHRRIDTHSRRRFPLWKARKLREDHEAWVRAMLPARGKGPNSWSVIFLEGAHPIDRRACLQALAPDGERDEPTIIRVDPRREWSGTSCC